MSDLAPKIASFYVETPRSLLAGGAPLSPMGVAAEVMRQFPSATIDELLRGKDIADELLCVDRKVQFEMERVNQPCECGAAGDIVLVDDDGHPTGQRRCLPCDLKEAEETPCVGCGGPMDGNEVRAGITLCDACDPDEMGWEDAG